MQTGEFIGERTQVATVVKARLQADNAEARYQRAKSLHDQKPPEVPGFTASPDRSRKAYAAER